MELVFRILDNIYKLNVNDMVISLRPTVRSFNDAFLK